MRGVLAAALFALASAGHSRSLRPSHSPKPKPTQQPWGEVWSAFWAYNTSSCQTPSTTAAAQFFVARSQPFPFSNNWNHYVSQPYNWPTLQPIYAKTLQFSGSFMAVDPVKRIGWALMSQTTWTTQTYIVQLLFPANNPNSSAVLGVCQVTDPALTPYTIGKLYFSPRVHTTGPWFLWPTNGLGPTPVTTLDVPPLSHEELDGLSGGPKPIPNCTLANQTMITDPSFQPNRLPAPFVGTDRRGGPLVAMITTSQTNTSQMLLQTWSALTGRLVFNSTYACGYPSYLYSCPSTTGGGWPTSGVFGQYLVNGTLLIGGGDWSGQQYFQGTVSALADDQDEDEDELDGQEQEGQADIGAYIPTLTYLNSSTNQGTWMANQVGSPAMLFVPKPQAWPINMQWIAAGGGTCVAPYNSANTALLSVTSADGSLVNTTYGGVIVPSPSCPFLESDIPGWYATAACAGAAVGFPDGLRPY